jgi:hypothetical protein
VIALRSLFIGVVLAAASYANDGGSVVLSTVDAVGCGTHSGKTGNFYCEITADCTCAFGHV